MNEQDTRAGQCNYPEDRDYRQQKDNGKKAKAFGDEIQEWKRRRRRGVGATSTSLHVVISNFKSKITVLT
jgi:hypothetical protein